MHKVAHKLIEAMKSGNQALIAAARARFWDKTNWAPGCSQCNGYQCVKYEGGFGNKRTA